MFIIKFTCEDEETLETLKEYVRNLVSMTNDHTIYESHMIEEE